MPLTFRNFSLHSSSSCFSIKKIINSAKYKILVADHSKFDKVAVENCGYLEDIDLIITDSGISDDILEKYMEKVKIEVV